MKKTIAVLAVLAVCAIVLLPTRNTKPPAVEAARGTVQSSLEELEQTLTLLEREASEDKLLMKFISEYRAKSLTQAQLEEGLHKLRDVSVDLIPMIHSTYGITDEDRQEVVNRQRAIARVVRSDYKVMWTEDFTGGKITNATNAWEEVKLEFQNSGLPLDSYDFSQRSINEHIGNMRPYSASHQIIADSQGVEVIGGDYRPLKNIQQRLLEYAPYYQVYGQAPSSIAPHKILSSRDALSKGRDLYLLKYVADSGIKEKQVIVFGASHAPHLLALLSEYGAKTALR